MSLLYVKVWREGTGLSSAPACQGGKSSKTAELMHARRAGGRALSISALALSHSSQQQTQFSGVLWAEAHKERK